MTSSTSPGNSSARPSPVVGIGASAGGLEAFSQLIRALPADTGMAYVLVPHLAPDHTSMMADILSRATTMPVEEVRDGTPAEPNRIHVIPPNYSMLIVDNVLKLIPRVEVRGQHRPIDRFLRSLAEDRRSQAIGVILSGTANDGTLGLEWIKTHGGITFAQDDSAGFDDMPRNAVAAGFVDFVLAPDKIAAELDRIARHPYLATVPSGGPGAPFSDPESEVAGILRILQQATGVDFAHYKSNTVHRRIARRMVLHKLVDMDAYRRLLRENSDESRLLHRDLLINVTSFFRDPAAFAVLRDRVLSRLTSGRSPRDPVRVWVVGCSSGEEAYSIAITFAELMETSADRIPLQLFATDLSEEAIARARTGLYPRGITQDVSPERIGRFFVEVDGGYRVSKAIREMCVFAHHNVLTEPPFSRMDLISCRNLLIYMDAVLQERILPLLHYALKPGGVLWLGTSESVSAHRDLFEVKSLSERMYSRRPESKAQGMLRSSGPKAQRSRGHAATRAPVTAAGGMEPSKEADRLLLARYTPPSVLINSDMEIMQFRGDTGPFLLSAPGKPSRNLLKMAREGLLIGLRAAIRQAMDESIKVRAEGLRVTADGQDRLIDIEVLPIPAGAALSGTFLVVFEDRRRAPLDAVPPGAHPAEDGDVARLTRELQATREYLHSVVSQQEAANEELQSASEEVQSANEELQSINEELETSKEEIQSTNEELATLNDELQHRNIELGQSNNDLLNLIDSVEVSIVMMDPELRIRRFTPSAEHILNLSASDVGRPIADARLPIEVAGLERILTEVAASGESREFEVRSREGHWYLLRLRPYRTIEHAIDGTVLTLLDVDTLKRHEAALRRQSDLLNQTRESILVRQFDGVIMYWNQGAERLYGYTREQATGRNIHELVATDNPPSSSDVEQALESVGEWSGELTQRTSDGRRIIVESRQRMVIDADSERLVLDTSRDITEQRRMEDERRKQLDLLGETNRHRNEFLAMLAHELRNPLAPLRSAAELLRSGGTDDSLAHESLDMIERQVRIISRMVEDLLDVSRITQGKILLRMEPVKLEAVIQEAVDMVRPAIESQEQKLEVILPAGAIWLEGDPLRLGEVVNNLLENASKFSPRRGRIWLHVERVTGDSGRGEVLMRVRDEGMGIDRELLPRVFDIFSQGQQSLERRRGGLGIGLTLVRRLVELHGGTVEASSEGPDRGSEFRVRLPVADPARLQKAATNAAPPVGPPLPDWSRRILVVDDNIDAARSLAGLLRRYGHDVRVAHNGPAALEHAVEGTPDIVFLDIGLPGMDGYEVARRFRAEFGPRAPVIVALTGYSLDEDRQMSAGTTFDRFLTKPIDIMTLRSIIAEIPVDRDSP